MEGGKDETIQHLAAVSTCAQFGCSQQGSRLIPPSHTLHSKQLVASHLNNIMPVIFIKGTTQRDILPLYRNAHVQTRQLQSLLVPLQ